MTSMLKRTLRHLKCVHFYDIPEIALLDNIDWFYTIELPTASGLVYISENRTASIKEMNNGIGFVDDEDYVDGEGDDNNNNRNEHLGLQTLNTLIVPFDELPDMMDYFNHNIILTVYAIINKEEDQSGTENPTGVSNQSVKIKSMEICLDNDLILLKKGQLMESLNKKLKIKPYFQFNDNKWYTLKQGMTVDSNFKNTSLSKNKKSYNYNSLLKLNKMVEYYHELEQETLELKFIIDQKYEKNHGSLKKKLPAGLIKESLKNLELKLKEQELLKLELEKTITVLKSSQQKYTQQLQDPIEIPYKNNDDSNETIKDQALQKQEFKELQRKKITRLLNVMLSTKFLEDLIERKNNTYPLFKLLDAQELLLKSQSSETDRVSLNSKLGYYVLIMKILTDKILNLPLRHSVQFYGSTSLVEFKLPLYILPTSNAKQNASFSYAVQCFNVNINQLQSYVKKVYPH